MKSNAQFIEALEPRVAPAILVNGGNLLGGNGNPTTGETSTGANTVTLVKVLSGQALVFYNNGVITGISVGKHTKLDITGDVQGDIVTNLDANGRLSDSDNNPINGEDGGVLNGFGIKGITTHPLGTETGSIGRIIAGGAVSNVNIAGQCAGIYAGDGIFRDSAVAKVTTGPVDTNSVLSGTQDTFVFSKTSTVPSNNAAITNVTVHTAQGLEIFAGSGASNASGTGVNGSSISNVTIAKTLAAQGTAPVLYLYAGDGGSGTNGGNGGSISSFNDQGSIAYVKLETGNGGAASNGLGGSGGALTSSTIVSSSTRYDFIMGNGGTGATGGVGGGIKGLTFTNNITGGASLIATDDFNGDGLPDVVLVNTLTGEATVSLGTTTVQHPGEANFTVAMQSITQANGTTVQTPFLPAEGGNPTSLVVTDLNGDGLPDFVVSYASTDSLGVFLNHGNGQFTPSKVDLGTISPTRIVAGEFSGSGHADIAIVSAAAITTAQTGLSSEVFIATNDGTGHLTVPTTAAVTLPGVATDAAGAQAYDTTTGAPVTNANLFIGFQNGTISPVFFQNGVPTVKASINAFVVNQVPVPAPVDSLDAEVSGGLYSVLAYSKDVNAAGTAAGNTTLGMLPQVDVFALDSTGQASAPLIITPDASVTKVHFVAGTNLVGAVEPGAVTIYNVVERNYVALDTLTSTGALSDFSVTNQNGTYQIAAVGAASNRFFFTTGDPGSTAGVTPFLASETPFEPRAINFTTGDGGNGGALAGGAGGMIKGLTYTQTLGGGVLEAGGSYNTVLTTGHGGTSNGGGGGNGGGIQNVNLSLNPAYLTYSDDTTSAVFSTGAGGQGTTGGNGGSVSKVATTSVFSETNGSDGIYLNSVAVNLETGAGGVGTAAAGGAGGSISLAGQAAFSGVTFVDSDSLAASNPGLLVKAGDGGNGVTAGGAGGSLTNVGSQNATQSGSVFTGNELASALLSSGSGGAASAGNGGAGGSITGSNVTTQEAGLAVVINNVSQPPVAKDGSVTVISGNGGVGHGGSWRRRGLHQPVHGGLGGRRPGERLRGARQGRGRRQRRHGRRQGRFAQADDDQRPGGPDPLRGGGRRRERRQRTEGWLRRQGRRGEEPLANQGREQRDQRDPGGQRRPGRGGSGRRGRRGEEHQHGRLHRAAVHGHREPGSLLQPAHGVGGSGGVVRFEPGSAGDLRRSRRQRRRERFGGERGGPADRGHRGERGGERAFRGRQQGGQHHGGPDRLPGGPVAHDLRVGGRQRGVAGGGGAHRRIYPRGGGQRHQHQGQQPDRALYLQRLSWPSGRLWRDRAERSFNAEARRVAEKGQRKRRPSVTGSGAEDW